MLETWVPSLCQEDSLEEVMAIHSSILAWKEEPNGLQSRGSKTVRPNWSELTLTLSLTHLRLLFVGPLQLGLVGGYSSLQWTVVAPPGVEHRLQGVLGSAAASQGFPNCGSKALEHRLSSCGLWTLVAHSMWNPLGSGTKPRSSILAGRLLSSVPPG